MARQQKKLTPLAISRASKPGLYGDGGGLYLQIGPTGAKSWLFRFMRSGRAREMGLGPLHTVSLPEARDRAYECRKQLLEGLDPIEQRKAREAASKLEQARAMTFKQCAVAFIEAKRPEWKNDKHAQQWENTLRDYVHPLLGNLPVAAVDTDLIVKCLSPIWTTKTETATRVRGRIESVLNWATTRGFRKGENPARWRGHLETLLAKPSKVARVAHHAALHYEKIGEFIQTLREEQSVSAMALEFAVLTACRTNEVIGATWKEIDECKCVWTIPGDRMKMGKEHRVPLSSRAIQILGQAEAVKNGDYVFPGAKEKKPLSNMALLMALRRLNRTDITAHGFRSTFRDWAAEVTAYPREVAEMALAHAISNETEAAYLRGDLFEKRRRMMEDWARYCSTVSPQGEVIPINRSLTAA